MIINRIAALSILKLSFYNSTFQSLKINDKIKDALTRMNIINMTNIQKKSVAQIIEGNHAYIKSEAGSGKTLCYALPILSQLYDKQPNQTNHGAIILSPTKELGLQIYRQFRQLDLEKQINISRLGSLSVISGVVDLISDEQEKKRANFQEDVANKSFLNQVKCVDWNYLDVLITQPNQLERIIEELKDQGKFNLNPQTFVVDEFDLLSTEESLSASTLNLLGVFGKRGAQIILSCTTAPEEIQGTLADKYLKNKFPHLLHFESDNYFQMPKFFKHDLIELDTSYQNAYEHLASIIERDQEPKIVFANDKDSVLFIKDELKVRNIKAVAFHSDLSTENRIRIMSEFQNGDFKILIATDLASRGYDFPFVNHAIQFNFAGDPNTFLHRIGRVIRNNKNGFGNNKNLILLQLVTSFLRNQEKKNWEMIQHFLQKNGFKNPISQKRLNSKKVRLDLYDEE